MLPSTSSAGAASVAGAALFVSFFFSFLAFRSFCSNLILNTELGSCPSLLLAAKLLSLIPTIPRVQVACMFFTTPLDTSAAVTATAMLQTFATNPRNGVVRISRQLPVPYFIFNGSLRPNRRRTEDGRGAWKRRAGSVTPHATVGTSHPAGWPWAPLAQWRLCWLSPEADPESQSH